YYPIVQEKYQAYYGVDISAEMLRKARQKQKHYRKIESHWKRARLDHLPYPDAHFEAILCNRVLSHIEDLSGVFEEFHRVLKPGKQVMLTDIHPEHHYHHTGFRLADEKIYVETYKHPLEALIEIAEEEGLILIPRRMKEFKLSQLPHPPQPGSLAKLYDHPESKIFYALVFEKMTYGR
ncbi:MAG: class I SAM-dependent methyltransferase, partial [Bacteroidota bacterium]